VVYDGVEGVRRFQDEVTVESGEGYVALVVEWGETEFDVEETNGIRGDSEET
jgi:hypothetical protein